MVLSWENGVYHKYILKIFNLLKNCYSLPQWIQIHIKIKVNVSICLMFCYYGKQFIEMDSS